jgi:CrcB protein
VITILAFAAAAAIGAVARAEVAGRGNRPGLPWGTFAVNVSGAFLLGTLHDVGPPMVTVLGTAGLGAYTTFSSFAGDAFALKERRSILRAGIYVAVTVVIGVAAAALGRGVVT